MKIYLAARYSRREELCGYTATLAALGHTVTSRWLDGNHQVSDDGLSAEGTPEQRERFALEDWHDLQSAECCIAFTEPPRSSASRGGRHVELGAALAWGKRVIVVGPRENVFCCLPGVLWFARWDEALPALRETVEPEAMRRLLAENERLKARIRGLRAEMRHITSLALVAQVWQEGEGEG